MTRIVHTMLESPFTDGLGYQENIMTAKHCQLGYDVHVISYNSPGSTAPAPRIYTASSGATIHVLANNSSVLTKVPFVTGWTDKTLGLYSKLEELAPDILFLHGICAHDHVHVLRYKAAHPEVKIFADNHSDYYNTPVRTLKHKSYRLVFGRYIGRRIGAVAERVWGVTPWRVDYLKDVYHVPSEKVGLLVMGGDEALIRWAERDSVRQEIRSRYGIPHDAFLVITGGKIDRTKNIHLLIEAVRAIGLNDVHLLVFGRNEGDMKEYMESLSDPRIHCIGWIKAEAAYDHFLAADLACFPGTHSVLWEQACASGLPAVFKDWDGGFAHVDVGGNCELLKDVTTDSIKAMLLRFIDDEVFYKRHSEVAATLGRKEFSYMEISRRAISNTPKK